MKTVEERARQAAAWIRMYEDADRTRPRTPEAKERDLVDVIATAIARAITAERRRAGKEARRG